MGAEWWQKQNISGMDLKRLRRWNDQGRTVEFLNLTAAAAARRIELATGAVYDPAFLVLAVAPTVDMTWRRN